MQRMMSPAASQLARVSDSGRHAASRAGNAPPLSFRSRGRRAVAAAPCMLREVGSRAPPPTSSRPVVLCRLEGSGAMERRRRLWPAPGRQVVLRMLLLLVSMLLLRFLSSSLSGFLSASTHTGARVSTRQPRAAVAIAGLQFCLPGQTWVSVQSQIGR